MAIFQIGQRWIGALANFVLPPVCAVCEGRLQSAKPVGICPTCWSTLSRLDPDKEPALTHLLDEKGFDAFYAPFCYEEEVVSLLTRFKYYQSPHLAQALAPFMRAVVPDWSAYEVIVPVPVDRLRLLRRGYNQAAELVRVLADLTQRPFDALGLVRVRLAGRQVGRGREARRRALSGAFYADPRFKGKTVLLVDDVLTTGGTAQACAKALYAAGAVRVDVLVAAWVRP